LQVPTELIESCRRGEPGAFDELVRTTHKTVYALAYRMLRNAEDASDVTQEVYLRVWRHMGRYRGEADFGTWLHRITVNRALTHIQKASKRPQPSIKDELPEVPVEDRTEQQADADLLERALARLPEQQRMVVILKDVYGWTGEEIAKAMGSTEGAIKVRVFRARQRLADELAASGIVVDMTKRKRRSS
jgi:RNA polymerase sigma-70 factor, ECF subfamily